MPAQGGVDEDAGPALLEARLRSVQELIQADDATAAKAAVIETLDDVERLCGLQPDPAVRSRLIARLKLIESAEPPEAAAPLVAHLLREGLHTATLTGDADAALPFGHAALALADRLGLPLLAARVHSDLAAVYGTRDLYERALTHLRAGIEVLEQAGEPVFPALVNNLGNVYMATDRVEEALACFKRAAWSCQEEGDRLRQGIALANVGRALTVLRRHDEALEVLEEALELFRGLNRRAYVATTLAKLGAAHVAVGDLAGAVTRFEEARRQADDEALPFRAEVVEAYGRALLEVGQPEKALEELGLARGLHQGYGARQAAAGLLRDEARALALLGRHEEAYGRLLQHLEEQEQLQEERGEVLLGVLLVELEAGLAADHELPVLTGRALKEANRALRAQAARLERLSVTDELTQVYNRRYLNDRLRDAVARRQKRPDLDVCLVLFDVDGFKAINDRYSHLVGDEVLRRTAELLSKTFRRTDVVARLGGEEFAVLLVGASLDAAARCAESARQAVASAGWDTVAGGLAVTVSAGVASALELAEEADFTELLKLADRRLYRAKSEGRDRVVSWG